MAGHNWNRTPSRVLEIAVLLLLPVAYHCLFPGVVIVSRPYSFAGLPPMLFGLGLMIWSASELRAAGATCDMHAGGSALVRTGPYRFSRSPIYLGMLVWLLGLALLLGSLGTSVFPIVFWSLANRFLLPGEEWRMVREHGESFGLYKASVRRWI